MNTQIAQPPKLIPAASPQACDAPWFVPTQVMTLADGSTLLKHGKPVQRATASVVSKWFGISKKNLCNLAEAGFIREAKPTPFSHFYYPAEVEAFIIRTEEDPNFWDKVKREAYLRVRRLRTPLKDTPEK